MYKRKKLLFMVMVVVLGFLLAGCGQSRMEIGMVETNLPGDWQASYTTFTGMKTRTFEAQAGERLMLEYDLRVSKGTLTVLVENPEDQVVWELASGDDDSGEIQPNLEESGRYRFVVEGQSTGGGWELAWEIE